MGMFDSVYCEHKVIGHTGVSAETEFQTKDLTGKDGYACGNLDRYLIKSDGSILISYATYNDKVASYIPLQEDDYLPDHFEFYDESERFLALVKDRKVQKIYTLSKDCL